LKDLIKSFSLRQLLVLFAELYRPSEAASPFPATVALSVTTSFTMRKSQTLEANRLGSVPILDLQRQ
jgi:hypothetical protein